ncbi:hypothetical protein STEG23_015067 [Scotinomys teguina]
MTNTGSGTMEVVAAALSCQLLLIVLMVVMLLPGMKVSLLLVQRTVTRTIELQESISSGQLGHLLKVQDTCWETEECAEDTGHPQKMQDTCRGHRTLKKTQDTEEDTGHNRGHSTLQRTLDTEEDTRHCSGHRTLQKTQDTAEDTVHLRKVL